MRRIVWALGLSLLVHAGVLIFVGGDWRMDTPPAEQVELVLDDEYGSIYSETYHGFDLAYGVPGREPGLKGTDGITQTNRSEVTKNGTGSGASPPGSSQNGPGQASKSGGASSDPNPSVSETGPEPPDREEPFPSHETGSQSFKGGETASLQEKDYHGEGGLPDSGGTVNGKVDKGNGPGSAGPAGGSGNGVGGGGSGTGSGSGSPGGSGGGAKGSGENGGGGGSPNGSQVGAFQPPVLIKDSKPEYPEEARRQGWEGRTLLELTIDPGGRVREVKVVESSGHEVLDRAAVSAARRWRYRPALRGGVPVEARVRRPVRFKLV